MKATIDSFRQLRWFKPHEFKHPFQLDHDFLWWLDLVRTMADVPFVITSDFRSHIPIGGYSQSLHLVGRAVDIRYPWLGPGFTDGRKLAKITEAIVQTPSPVPGGGYEFGIEHGAPGGAHLHIGLYTEDRPEPYIFVR